MAPPSSAERVALIRLFQDAGFTLVEVGRLFPGSRAAVAWGQLAGRKLTELDACIVDAQRAKELISHGLECPHRNLFACPNFRSALKARLERPG